MKNIWKLIIAIIISEGAGLIGAFYTTPTIASGWYDSLEKASLNPPSWVFGPVWVALFALMGIALFLVWSSFATPFAKATGVKKATEGREKRNIKIAWVIFVIQLVLNVFWSFIFFTRQNPIGALIEIIFLWIAILLTIIFFAKVSKPAAWLLVPYIAWVTFAIYLNYSVWVLNLPKIFNP